MERISQRIPELDGLRGIAIAMVVLWHARPEPVQMFEPLPFLYRLIAFGPYGVDLFFVLSGFLITGILLDSKGEPGYFRSFYARRVLRILPVYFVALAGFFWVTLPWLHRAGVGLEASTSEQVWYWLFLSNWRDAAGHIISSVGHFWSLAVEEQFYLFWPLIICICPRRYFPSVCVAAGAFSLAVRMAMYAGHFVAPELLYEWVHRATIARLDTLSIGALVAVLVRSPQWLQPIRRSVKVVAPVAFICYGVLWYSEDASPFLMNTVGFTVLAVGFACMLLVCVTDQGSSHLLCRITRLRVLRSMGRYSYAMYVFHLAAMFWLKDFALTVIVPRIRTIGFVRATPMLVVSLIALSSCLLASYLVGLLSWHLMEKHFLRLKDRFSYQAGRQEAPLLETASAD